MGSLRRRLQGLSLSHTQPTPFKGTDTGSHSPARPWEAYAEPGRRACRDMDPLLQVSPQSATSLRRLCLPVSGLDSGVPGGASFRVQGRGKGSSHCCPHPGPCPLVRAWRQNTAPWSSPPQQSQMPRFVRAPGRVKQLQLSVCSEDSKPPLPATGQSALVSPAGVGRVGWGRPQRRGSLEWKFH